MRKYLGPWCFVIGKYRPTVFDRKTIENDLNSLVAGLGFIAYHGNDPRLIGDVRDPERVRHIKKIDIQNEDVYRQSVSAFHHDGYGRDKGATGVEYNEAVALILWATMKPTEIQLPDQTIVSAKPHELVMISNKHLTHRTPATIGTNRWFYRGVVFAPESNPGIVFN